ncbi:MAG: hypothetical protein ACYC9Q_14180 [Bacillota bacterium]
MQKIDLSTIHPATALETLLFGIYQELVELNQKTPTPVRTEPSKTEAPAQRATPPAAAPVAEPAPAPVPMLEPPAPQPKKGGKKG